MPSDLIASSDFRVTEVRGVASLDDGMAVAGPDAAVRLAPARRPLVGLCKAEIHFSAPEVSCAAFEAVFGARGSETRAPLQLFHVGRGRYEGLFTLPEPLAGLVIYPNAPGSRFEVRRFIFSPLGPLERALQLGGRALMTLRRGPAALISVVRRLEAARVHSDIVVVPLKPSLRRSARYEEWLARHDDDPAADAPLYRDRLGRAGPLPSFAVLLPAPTDPDAAGRTIASLEGQLYDNWELLVPERSAHSADPRIRQLTFTTATDDAALLNAALAQTRGDWVLSPPPGAVLRPHALAEFALALAAHTTAVAVYSDEDRIDGVGARSDPRFKPDWSPDLLRSWNYVGQLAAWPRETVLNAGGWRAGFASARDHDLTLRVTERAPGDAVRHVPKILVHLPNRTGASQSSPGAGAGEGALAAVSDHLARTGRRAKAEPVTATNVVHVQYAPPTPAPLVSIIVPTRDRLALLQTCLHSLLDKTAYAPFEVLIVDNGSSDPGALAFLSAVDDGSRVRVIPCPGAFNYSRLNNFAAAQARGSVLALVNNDIEVITPGWLAEMVGHACRPEVGCVGAKLYYPNDTVQHAGVVLGLGGVAAHGHRGLPRNDPGYLFRAACACNVSAVSAACLVLRRSVYEEVGGFDEGELAVAFNDVDLCLKVRERGYLNVWTPFAELYHHESASRGLEATPEQIKRSMGEIAVMKRRWGHLLLRDPYYSPNLTLSGEDYGIRS